MRPTRLSLLHAELRQARLFAGGVTKKAGEARNKHYPRFPDLPLAHATLSNDSLSYALAHRHSARDTDFSGTPLTITQLGALLEGVRSREKGKRSYPSGGELYPIETYVLAAPEKDLTVYHYSPEKHALESLWAIPDNINLQLLTGRQDRVLPLPSTFIIFTAVWHKSIREYGDFAYDLCLLEAGHMAQNILLIAAALSLSARAVGGFSDTLVEELLDIQHSGEQPIYILALG